MNTQALTVELPLLFYIIDKEKGLQGFNRILDEREECLVDRDKGVYDPFLSMGSVSITKEKL